MKSSIFTVLTTSLLYFGVVVSSSAQGEANPYKQIAKDNNIEISFDPSAIFNASSTSPIFGLQNGVGIKYRYFFSQSNALRVGVNVNYRNTVTITQQLDPLLSQIELQDKFSQIGIFLRGGMERHFKGTRRLSPYIGGEIIFGLGQSNTISEIQVDASVKEYTFKNGTPGDGTSFGFAGVSGVDYYIVERLYLGLEISYALIYFSESTSKFTSFDGTVVEFNRGSNFQFSPQAYAIFRIGYLL